MKDIIEISTGLVTKTLHIDGKRDVVLEFNPEDVVWVERLNQIMDDLNKKAAEEKAAKENNQTAQSFQQGLQAHRDFCAFLDHAIDELFGEGKAKEIFGASISTPARMSLLEGVSPYIEAKRYEKLAEYSVE